MGKRRRRGIEKQQARRALIRELLSVALKRVKSLVKLNMLVKYVGFNTPAEAKAYLKYYIK